MEFIDPRTTPFVPLKSRGELPHLYKPGCCHFVTFRLLDAVILKPRRVAAGANCGAGFPSCTLKPSGDSVAPKKLEDLDPGEFLKDFEPPIARGSCYLNEPKIAQMVQSAILHFHGDRYELVAWCVMPNHVHVIFAPRDDRLPDEIIKSWKGFSAREANRILARSGPFWERESFDHLIRSAQSVERFARYVEDNPVVAGLCESPYEWPYSSAGSGFVSPVGRR